MTRLELIAEAIAELVRHGTPAETIGRVAAAFVALGTPVSVDARRGRPGNAESAGAARTRAYRARLAAQASQMPTGDASVTLVVASVIAPEVPEMQVLAAAAPAAVIPLAPVRTVTKRHNSPICDAAPEKEKPPHPHKKNYPPKAPLAVTRRHRPGKRQQVTVDDPRTYVASGSALYRELVAMTVRAGGRVPERGGWYFTTEAIAAAEHRLSSSVAVLPVRAVAPEQGAGEDGQEARAQR